MAAEEIDRWFAELAKMREVDLFYIVSPSHWGLSVRDFSVTDGAWRIPGGLVESDRVRANALARALDVPLEPAVFDPEHGVSTLVPFLARHFPKARVAAVAVQGEPPLDQPPAERLARALAPIFKGRDRARCFLLVSTDFSHHGDEATTRARDERSRAFFDSPSGDTYILAGCDNRPGLYALGRLAVPETKAAILFHTDSLALSGKGASDITSYFFSFIW